MLATKSDTLRVRTFFFFKPPKHPQGVQVMKFKSMDGLHYLERCLPFSHVELFLCNCAAARALRKFSPCSALFVHRACKIVIHFLCCLAAFFFWQKTRSCKEKFELFEIIRSTARLRSVGFFLR